MARLALHSQFVKKENSQSKVDIIRQKTDNKELSVIKSIEDLQAYREQILNLAEQYGVQNIRVFGSVARGEAQSGSDIDFLVDFGQHSLVDRIQFMQSLSLLLECDVDVVQEKNLRPHVKQQALREAKRL